MARAGRMPAGDGHWQAGPFRPERTILSDRKDLSVLRTSFYYGKNGTKREPPRARRAKSWVGLGSVATSPADFFSTCQCHFSPKKDGNEDSEELWMLIHQFYLPILFHR